MRTGYVLTFGETMGLYSAQRTGELHLGDSYRFSVGGTESNLAIGLTRLGTPSAWVGRVGRDEVGRVIARTLRAEGVDAHVIIDAEAPSAVMTRGRRLPGRASVSYFRSGSAGSRLRPADVPRSLISAAAILHVTGVTPALSETARQTVRQAVQTARQIGVPVSVDINYRARLWPPDEAVGVLTELLSKADIVLAGEDEAELITGHCALEDQLHSLSALGPSQVVIKQGAAGATARVDGEDHHAPGVPITVVDTVGAGDAFAAGYLHALLRGEDPTLRLSIANRVAAFVCQSEGDWEGLPLLEELPLLDDKEPVVR